MPQARDEAGNIWEVDAQGNAVRLIQPANRPMPIAPMNPAQQFEAPKAQADAQRAQAEAALAQAQTPYAGQIAQAEVQKALAEAAKARAEAGRDPNAQKLDRGKVGQFLALEKQLARLRELYRSGPGATSGASSVMDYLPSDANSRFDSAGAGLSEVGLAAFRVPGVGSQSDAELRQFIAANTPRASDRDAAIEEKLRNLETRLQATKQAWGVDPAAPAAQLLQQFEGGDTANTNAMGQIRTTGGGSPEMQAVPLADSGSRQFRTVDDPALARAHDDLVQSLITKNGGRLDPGEYAVAVGRLVGEFGYTDPTGPEGRKTWASEVNKYLDGGGRTIPTSLTAREVMSANEIAANNLVNNPLAGAIIGSINGVTGGVPEAIAPGQFSALRDSQPVPMLVGEIGGAIGGIKGLGTLGRSIASRVAPSLLGGGAKGQVLRNVAVDTGYGAAYGQNTQGDPMTGAALGLGGSLLGQGGARTLGAAIGGLQRTPAAQALRERGVPVSVARQLGLGRAEDLSQSIPVVGDMSRARQAESFVGFNQAAFQEGAKPIGATIPSIAGRDGVTALDNAVGTAYDDATRGVNVGIDPQFTTDFAALSRQIGGLPGDYQAAARQVVQNRVAPAVSGGQMTGEQYQQAIRGIRAARSNADNVGNTGFEQDYRNVLGGAENMLTGVMGRGGGQQTVDGLRSANEAFGNLKILEDAALNRARVGTRSGEINVFAPSQLLDAARKAEVQYGSGAALRRLGEQGQEVLPSTVPNSGTADRTLFAGLLGGAGLAGSGAGYANDQSVGGAAEGAGSGIGATIGIGAILAALGTRRGQQALEQILISRPQTAQAIGSGFRRRAGLFGSAGAVAAQ